MRDVIGKRQLLRPSNMILESLSQRGSGSDSAAKVANMLHRRFSLGYIISRWRTETGEEVAAFNRGKCALSIITISQVASLILFQVL